MERKLLQSDWNEMRGQISEWWDDLTDEDLDRVNGDQEQLIRILQERYCYTRNLAVLEVERHLAAYTNPQKHNQSVLDWYEDDFSSISSRNWNENDNEFSRGRLNKSRHKGNGNSPEGSFLVHAKNRARIVSKAEQFN